MSSPDCLEGKKAVVFEDDILVMNQIYEILSRQGIRVLRAMQSGTRAVGIVSSEKPDIVIVDATLSGIDGWEASRKILAQQDACIIMLTVRPEREVLLLKHDIRVRGCVSKPFNAEHLLEQIYRCLGVRRRADSDPASGWHREEY